jgi:hypothetical protein
MHADEAVYRARRIYDQMSQIAINVWKTSIVFF